MLLHRHFMVMPFKAHLDMLHTGFEKLIPSNQPVLRAMWEAGGEEAINNSFAGTGPFTASALCLLPMTDNMVPICGWPEDWVNAASSKDLSCFSFFVTAIPGEVTCSSLAC